MAEQAKEKILIADDSEMNRSILTDMLEDKYEIIEAEDGAKAVAILQEHCTDISLVLLDIVMPEMDGFQVMEVMNNRHWIDDIPVIIISSETAAGHVERAYSLGCTDFISRPFDALVVHRRVVNTILLYAKQKKLVGMVTEQIYEKERQSDMMIDILSHIVEFRNGESAQHVLNVRVLTDLFLSRLVEKTDRYHLSRSEVSRISTAASLHDVGKIAVPSEVLNKPGRFTPEEFAIMKTHPVIGSQMLDQLPGYYHDDPLVRTARDICRWHHERWDGRGYPDGLAGDDIPISAQVVALADVYDALTSERVYKPPLSHQRATEMILGGECGTFNPLLLDCLRDLSDSLPQELRSAGKGRVSAAAISNLEKEMHGKEGLSASERTLHLLEHERMKYSFFATMSQEIQFEYTPDPPMVTLNAWGAHKLGLKETILDPLHNPQVLSRLELAGLEGLIRALHTTTPSQPVVKYDCRIGVDGESRWFQVIARATWTADDPPQYAGAIGKAVDIHESRMKLAELERRATHDTLTGLLNHASARERIQARLAGHPEEQFALAILDLDHFKSANDTYGHIFGDRVLKYLASRIQESIRGEDIAARVGGDEFLIFLEYRGDLEAIISRIYASLSGSNFEQFRISVSMGVSRTETVGTDYQTLFQAADQALYVVKGSGKGRYQFFMDAMEDNALSVISPIDGGGQPAADEKGGAQP